MPAGALSFQRRQPHTAISSGQRDTFYPSVPAESGEVYIIKFFGAAK